MDIEQRVDEHELRLRKLETNNIEMQMQIKDIQKSQVEIKNMLLEQDKNNTKIQEKNQELMEDLVKNLTASITDTVKSNNNDNTYSKKQFWIFLGSIVGIFGTIVLILDKLFK